MKYSLLLDLPKRAGWYENIAGHRIYLFTEAGLLDATGHRFDLDKVLAALDAANAFTAKGPNGEYAIARHVPDGRIIKLYHLDPKKMALKINSSKLE